MASAGDLRPIGKHLGVYEVTVPYASVGAVGELEILMEVHPCVAASHHTAMAFHGFTDDQPKVVHATVPLGKDGPVPAAGTRLEDWQDLPRAPARFPDRILERTVRWHRVQGHRFVGIGEYQPEGWPVRVTTPERTLLDGLLEPDHCGGLGTVLRAWSQARDLLDTSAVVALTDRLDVGVLRQRVGFVMEAIGLSHSALEQWQAKGRRGGSSRLHASAPYASRFDERWNLSINAPTDSLREGAA
jgi:predicted transcriptional regulator of viral defense system